MHWWLQRLSFTCLASDSPMMAPIAQYQASFLELALAFYLDTGEFRTDLLQTLRGIQDALERISDHLQTN